MTYGRFDVPKDWITLGPDQVAEYSAAAEVHYSTDLEYHNYRDHASEVALGVDVIADKLEERGHVIARGALIVAAYWHDVEVHEDHSKKGFKTKESYSAALLGRYLQGRPVGEYEKVIMLNAIDATYAGFEGLRSPYELILHRSDIANIGGPLEEFLANSGKLWREQVFTTGRDISWQAYVEAAIPFIVKTIEEHDRESVAYGLELNDTVIDVNNEPFRIAAARNMAALMEYRLTS